jgi:hypothetical protein
LFQIIYVLGASSERDTPARLATPDPEIQLAEPKVCGFMASYIVVLKQEVCIDFSLFTNLSFPAAVLRIRDPVPF